MGVFIDTHFILDEPPLGDVGLEAQTTGEAVGVVKQMVLVDNPVGIIFFIPRIQTVAKQTVAAAILVEIMLHVVERRPCINAIEGTVTA